MLLPRPQLWIGVIRAVHAGPPQRYDVQVDQLASGSVRRGLAALATPGGAYAAGDSVVVGFLAGQDSMVIVGRLE